MANLTGGLGQQIVANLQSNMPDVTAGESGITSFFGGIVSGFDAEKGRQARKAGGDAPNPDGKGGGKFDPNQSTSLLRSFAKGVVDTRGVMKAGSNPNFDIDRKILEQSARKNALEINDFVRKREMRLQAEEAFNGFVELASGHIKNGTTHTPESMNDILGYLSKNPEALSDPRMKQWQTMIQSSRELGLKQQEIQFNNNQIKSFQDQGLRIEGGSVPTMGGGKVEFGRPPDEKEFAPTEIERLLNAKDEAVKSGDTERAGILQSAIDAELAGSGFRVETTPDGRTIVTQGRSGTTTKQQNDAEGSIISASNFVEEGNQLLSLIDPSTIGAAAAVKRIIIDKGLAQFPGFENENNPKRAQTLASLKRFHAMSVESLKSDGQITEAERKEILAGLPSEGFIESAANAKALIRSHIKAHAKRARFIAKRAGSSIPMNLKTPIEIREMLNRGEITAEQAVSAIKKSPFDLNDNF